MPNYDYECKGCGHEFSKDQRITENPVKKCPSCGAMKAKRLISRTNFVLKGSGWYNDLYSSSGAKDKPAADTSGDAGAESSKSEGGASKDAKEKAPEKKAAPKAEGKSKKKSGQAAA